MANNTMLAKREELESTFHATPTQVTIGIDLGDRYSHCCLLGFDGIILTEGRVRSTPESMASHFKGLPHRGLPSKSELSRGGSASCSRNGVMTWSWRTLAICP
jgi:hypothetical protein